jgi:hypothetical protein
VQYPSRAGIKVHESFLGENKKDFFMEKGNISKKGIALIVLLGALIASVVLFVGAKPAVVSPSITPTKAVQQAQATQLNYKGQAGKDALTILKAKAIIEQDKSGLVTTINGRKADNAKHEYWAFYINSKSADVGPAQYQTQDTDTIEWKIEKY